MTTEIEKFGLSQIPHSPYTPNIPPSDSWLFGFLKEKFRDAQHTNRKQLLDLFLTILAEIQRIHLIAVYEDWIGRLKKAIEIEGEYLTR
jgi:hypothetical protein